MNGGLSFHSDMCRSTTATQFTFRMFLPRNFKIIDKEKMPPSSTFLPLLFPYSKHSSCNNKQKMLSLLSFSPYTCLCASQKCSTYYMRLTRSQRIRCRGRACTHGRTHVSLLFVVGLLALAGAHIRDTHRERGWSHINVPTDGSTSKRQLAIPHSGSEKESVAHASFASCEEKFPLLLACCAT
jgi:hypothetical protein